MDLGWLAALILQALGQAGLCHSVLGQQLAKVHVDGVLQDDIVLLCDEDVVNEAKGASLQQKHTN